MKVAKTDDKELNYVLDQILDTSSNNSNSPVKLNIENDLDTNLEELKIETNSTQNIQNNIDTRSWKDKLSGVKSEAQKEKAIAQAKEIRESLNSLQIREIIQYYAVHGQLPGQQVLVKHYLAREFEVMEEVINKSEKDKARLAASVVVNDTVILAKQIEADAQITMSKINLDIIRNKLSMAGQQQNAIEQEIQVKNGESKKIVSDETIANHRETKRVEKAKAKINKGSWWNDLWGK